MTIDSVEKRWAEAQTSIGQILTHEARRDALHFAVAPVTARATLQPGTHIGIDSRGYASTTEKALGIVDPFLPAAVKEGERFWLFLYPNTITALRHVWDHDAFAQEAQVFVPAGASKSEARLREIAAAIDIGYETMMSAAETWVATSTHSKWGGDYLVQQGSENWRDDFPQYADEFWRLYEDERGSTVPDEHKKSFFSCSC